jgi:DNA (cytosine-5)-methyltransferase 1
MRFGSVCSGIEAASVAWHPLGWKAAWLSEIEPFPSAVLAHHYPDVPNLGDMTALPERILSGEVEAPDVFCGGTPCQAFSVAGLRNSLDDARGNLSLTFVGIANAIDHVRSVRSDDPAIIFWENVPGVLSTKDNAFGCFLGALAGEDDPVTCPDGKWPTAGVVVGQKRAVAWRVLDAQYFGVAQRRRRVFVVASARDDFDPAAVLFEFNGVRRDTAPSREAGQEPATSPASGLDVSHTGNERVEAEAMVVQSTTVQTLRTKRPGEGGMSADHEHLVPVVSPALNTCSGSNHAPDTKAYVVHGTQDPCVSDIAFSQGRNNGGENVLVQPITQFGETAGTLTARYDSSPCADRGMNVLVQPIPFDTTQITSPANYSKPQAGDPCHPLAAGAHAPAVAQPIDFRNLRYHEGDVSGTMQSKSTGGYSLNYETGVQQNMAVRRLTPVECERLQGFPDGYTNIPWRKKDESPDGPRYKALGNSWAVPVVAWIGKRINEAVK